MSEVYENNKVPLHWKCNKDSYEWKANYNSILRGSWCPKCSGKAKVTILDCNEAALKNKGMCLSLDISNNKSKLKWRCSEGHVWQAKYVAVFNGHWCPVCAGNTKITINQISLIAKKNGGICLEEYIPGNNKVKIRFRCLNGHEFKASPNDIQQDHWCPHCSPQFSKAEKAILASVQNNFPDAKGNVRGLLKSKRLELDIWIPSIKTGIEYDGARWHNLPKTMERDSRKNQECIMAGIRLIRITEFVYKKDPEKTIQALLVSL